MHDQVLPSAEARARWEAAMRLSWSRLLRALRPDRLVDCERCGRDFVTPIAWHDLDADRWWIRLRCGECGWADEVVVDNEQARRFEADLDRGTQEIARSLSRMSREPEPRT